MTAMMNQLVLFTIANQRTVKIVLFTMLVLAVLAILLVPNTFAFAGPATSGAGHCSC